MPPQPWTGPTECKPLCISAETSKFCDLIPLKGDARGATLAMLKPTVDQLMSQLYGVLRGFSII
jgi:hypothetical protein